MKERKHICKEKEILKKNIGNKKEAKKEITRHNNRKKERKKERKDT